MSSSHPQETLPHRKHEPQGLTRTSASPNERGPESNRHSVWEGNGLRWKPRKLPFAAVQKVALQTQAAHQFEAARASSWGYASCDIRTKRTQ